MADVRLPRGAPLVAAALFGILNFGVSYALAYWGLLEAPAALASTVLALARLLTFALAVWQGMERFRWGGVAGGAVAVAGVAIVFVDQLRAVPVASLLALFATAITISLSTIVAKGLPSLHPVSTNAVAMVPGAAFLLALSALAGERAVLPARAEVWIAFVYLATVGSIGLFVGFFFVVKRWTASASAYSLVLTPIVTVALGGALASELVTLQFVLGTLLVMVGVYVGALSQPSPTLAAAPRARRAS